MSCTHNTNTQTPNVRAPRGGAARLLPGRGPCRRAQLLVRGCALWGLSGGDEWPWHRGGGWALVSLGRGRLWCQCQAYAGGPHQRRVHAARRKRGSHWHATAKAKRHRVCRPRRHPVCLWRHGYGEQAQERAARVHHRVAGVAAARRRSERHRLATECEALYGLQRGRGRPASDVWGHLQVAGRTSVSAFLQCLGAGVGDAARTTCAHDIRAERPRPGNPER